MRLEGATRFKFNHTATMTILVVAICLAIGYVSWLSFQNVGKIYLAETERTLTQLKESYLENTLNNVIQGIEHIKDEQVQRWKERIDDLQPVVQYGSGLGSSQFIEYFASLFPTSGQDWIALVWNNATDEVLYVQGGAIANLGDLFHYQTFIKGELVALWGVSEAHVNEHTRDLIEASLQELSFSDGAQIWVNTKMYDEAEYTSDFLSTSVFYEDLNLVIAMAIPRAELDQYLIQTELTSENLALLLSLRLVLVLVLLVILGLAIVLIAEHFYYRRTTEKLKVAVGKDILTGALSRRAGTEKLREAFASFQTGKPSPAILLCDVDNLKRINDTYGHFAGDEVLEGVVKAVEKSIRSSDLIIRWGGDEFILILHSVKTSAAKVICAKIVQAVSSLEFVFDDRRVNPTISLGAAQFVAEDENFIDAVNRADQALYQAKRAGKNRCEVYRESTEESLFFADPIIRRGDGDEDTNRNDN